ncbi:MAG: hypothetical protein ACXIUL_11890 [Wenzhouxiangella sp.]
MKARCLIIVLTLGLSLLAAPADARLSPSAPSSGAVGMSWLLVAFELGPWDDVLLHEITPQLERLSERPAPQVSWLRFDERLIVPDFALGLMSDQAPRLSFSLAGQHHRIDGEPLGWAPINLQQSLLMPGLTQQIGERSQIRVSAVLASQTFASGGMNLTESSELLSSPFAPVAYLGQSESVFGAGLRLAISGDLGQRLSLDAAYQSRIDMNELSNLQGVHGSRAVFDIPSRLQLGMNLQTTERTSFRFGVEQVFFSEVGAFPSRALPARFTALLGDSTSPDFDWNDLLVYSLGWQWRSDNALSVSLDYRTRSQPRPSSDVLASALSSELGQDVFILGLNKGLGERSLMRLNLSYAPPEIALGGHLLGVGQEQLDQIFELQASLSIAF